MKGFAIYINNQKIDTAVNQGVVLIIVNETNISISGTDNTLGLSIDWGRTNLCVGDKIRIVASDIEVNSDPVNINSLNRQELLTTYHQLKEFLIEQGLLQ